MRGSSIISIIRSTTAKSKESTIKLRFRSVADMVIEIFAMESALLRTLKKVERSGEEEARIHLAATQVYIDQAFPRVELLARQVLGAVSEGDDLRTQLAGLKKFARYTPINAVALRREVANSMLGVSRYHLSP